MAWWQFGILGLDCSYEGLCGAIIHKNLQPQTDSSIAVTARPVDTLLPCIGHTKGQCVSRCEDFVGGSVPPVNSLVILCSFQSRIGTHTHQVHLLGTLLQLIYLLLGGHKSCLDVHGVLLVLFVTSSAAA